MGYHYIALLAGPSGYAPQLSEMQATLLRDRGLQPRITAGPITLFVAQDTPTLTVPGGVLIGHLFSRDGTPAKPDRLPTLPSAEQFAQHLLTHYWGEYLLIQFDTGPAPGLDILREPSGGVSCLYSIQGSTGFVTSDVSLADELGYRRRQVDWDFIAQVLAYPHIKTARTGLSGVRELLPGCSLVLRNADTTIRQDWSPWAFVAKQHRHSNPEEAATEIRTTVAAVVQAWAQTDKAILMELSGGLDSSIVATCLRGTDTPVTCCTLMTPVPGADERQYAQQVTDALGTVLHAQSLGYEHACFDFMLPACTATPRIGVLQHVSHKVLTTAAQTHGTTSFFSGGGGDTVFCYLGNAVPAADAFREQGLSAGITAIRDMSMLHQCTYWKAGHLALRKLLRGAKAPYKADRSLLDPSIVAFAPDPHPWFIAPTGALPGDQERIADLVGTQMFRDSAPRGSTHWLRLPLLSQPVVEACLKVPSWMWITGGENRTVARSAFAGQLPRSVLERRSKGTFMNYLGAIYQRNKTQMCQYLLTGQLQEHRLLDADTLIQFLEEPPTPRDTSFMRVFDLCMIENWIRHQP
jgi:asparagine synthase (glutamine-hydrolysing)